MGSGSGFVGNREQSSGQGRHRRDETTPAWPANEPGNALARNGSGRHRRPEAGPGTDDTGSHARQSGAALGAPPTGTGSAEPEQDDPLDIGPAGLRMFNLGSIPASVTPPRSWRRAAWFAVAASVGALVGLFLITAVLVGPPRQAPRPIASPYFPDGKPLATIGGAAAAAHPRRAAHPAATTADVDAGVDTVDAMTSAPLAPTRTGPGRVRTTQPAPPVTVVTLPPSAATVPGGEPVVDPVQLIKRTRTFFTEVTSNAAAAAALTTSTLRDDTTAVIQQKYRNISTIRVQSIALDPNSGLTTSILQVVNKDGTTSTQRTTLQFTLSRDPKIVNFGSR